MHASPIWKPRLESAKEKETTAVDIIIFRISVWKKKSYNYHVADMKKENVPINANITFIQSDYHIDIGIMLEGRIYADVEGKW